jgi:hypothetical protein
LNLLNSHISSIRSERPRHRGHLRVFDFDDTLVRTDSKVYVVPPLGERYALTPAEFIAYERNTVDKLDFSDFERLISPREVKWMNRIMHAVHDHHGPEGLVILSARTSGEPIREYLTSRGLMGIEYVALANGDPKMKATWIDARIREDDLEFLEFYDDSIKHCAAIRGLQRLHPRCAIIARNINHRRIASLND